MGGDDRGRVGMGERGEQAMGVDTVRLVAAADLMTNAGREISGRAGGADRHVPGLPEDRHGLVMLCVQLDEARERFDLRLGAQLESAGGRLAGQATDAAAADSGAEFAHLPVAGR